MTVVADAGPLIAMAKIGGLEALFRLFPRVSIPPAVHDEAIRIGRERGSRPSDHGRRGRTREATDGPAL